MPFLLEKVTDMLFNIVGRDKHYSPKTSKELENIDFKMILKDGGEKKGE